MPAPRTKIVATLGPASAEPGGLDALLDAGVNVVRINCAHGTHATLRQYIEMVRRCAARKRLPLAILADLGGPKLRIGRFEGGAVDLEKGQRFTLTTAPVSGNKQRVSIDYAPLPREVHKGDQIHLNDGLISLTVTAVKGREIATRVDAGGTLSDRKGLSVPGAALRAPSVTRKDWSDLKLLAAAGVDYVGLSFVRSAADVNNLRRGMRRLRMDVPIVAKIEKQQAVDDLDDIVAAADAIMVARGDLGVECPIHEVPVLQKRIIRVCNAAGVPVITATQMLESMIASPRPTRAEATDVANAVLDGTDAVMLSGETATGKYPAAAVAVMRRIIDSSESYDGGGPAAVPMAAAEEPTIGKAIGYSAGKAADSVEAEAIVCMTQSGATARYIAKWRPRRPIIAVTPIAATWRRLGLLWGTQPVLVDHFGDDFDAACLQILRTLRAQRHLGRRRPVVITAGLPFSRHGRTNTIRIEPPPA
jgi:pyruvate kinase